MSIPIVSKTRPKFRVYKWLVQPECTAQEVSWQELFTKSEEQNQGFYVSHKAMVEEYGNNYQQKFMPVKYLHGHKHYTLFNINKEIESGEWYAIH